MFNGVALISLVLLSVRASDIELALLFKFCCWKVLENIRSRGSARPARAFSLFKHISLTRRSITQHRENRELYAKTTSMTARTSSQNVTSRFYNKFSIILSHKACNMYSKHASWKLNWHQRFEDNKKLLKNLSSYAHIVHITGKQAISRHRKYENGSEMYRNENCTCKACKTAVSNRQIRKSGTFIRLCRRAFLGSL